MGRFLRSRWAVEPILMVFVLALAPLSLNDFRLRSLGGYLAFAVLALSLDVVWGFGGVISFAQGAFFGVAGYAMALAMTRLELRIAPVAGAGVGIIVCVCLALVLGRFIFRRGVGAFYAAVFTLSFSVVLQQLVLQFPEVTGGANGIIIPESVFPSSPRSGYYIMLAIFATVLFGLVAVMRTDFGRILIAVRDNEERARFLGYDTPGIQRRAFAIGASVAAIGGMTYAPYVQLASSDLVGLTFSTLVLIWVGLGGRGSLVGAALGAILVNTAQLELGATFLLHWQLALGVAFICVVLFVPDGLHSFLELGLRRLDRPRHLRVGSRPLATTLRTETPPGELVLHTAGVAKNFESFQALGGVDLDLRAGELHCLIGPNGAGKTTLVDVLTGRTPSNGGTARLAGDSILGKTSDELAAAGLRRKFQATNVFDTMSVAENLHLASSSGRAGLVSLLHRTRELALPEPVMELLRESGLADRLPDQAGSLSHGEKQWLELCMVLAGEPRVVLLDEPTAGLTSVERRRIGAALRRMTQQGLAVLLIEHDFDFVRDVADRVTLLHQGRVVAEGTVTEMTNNDSVREVYLGVLR